jgi:hypothetical protein
LFERANFTGKAGDFFPWTIVDHKHEMASGNTGLFGSGPVRLMGRYNGTVTAPTDLTSLAVDTGGTPIAANHIDTEVRPDNHLINKYILV